MPSRRLLAAVAAVVSCAVIGVAGCGGGGDGGPAGAAVAGDPVAGKAVYDNACAACHGVGATGTDRGPTFLDAVYEPSHHGDASFLLAVRNGSPAHHWSFGDMPPVPGVSDAQVADIVAYVRSLQRAAGIG
jgi:mono/diheme cytochrome c family protein